MVTAVKGGEDGRSRCADLVVRAVETTGRAGNRAASSCRWSAGRSRRSSDPARSARSGCRSTAVSVARGGPRSSVDLPRRPCRAARGERAARPRPRETPIEARPRRVGRDAVRPSSWRPDSAAWPVADGARLAEVLWSRGRVGVAVPGPSTVDVQVGPATADGPRRRSPGSSSTAGGRPTEASVRVSAPSWASAPTTRGGWSPGRSTARTGRLAARGASRASRSVRDDPAGMVSDHWEFRADRAATPAVFGWAGCRRRRGPGRRDGPARHDRARARPRGRHRRGVGVADVPVPRGAGQLRRLAAAAARPKSPRTRGSPASGCG